MPGRSTVVAYAPSVRAHVETVLRCFYDFHLAAGDGPIVNPFPLYRSRRGRRAHAHHKPMEPLRHECTGLYRPRVPSRIPRSITDEEFYEIFAKLPRTGTGIWWRSTSPPARGPRSCCRPLRVVWIPGGS